MTMPNRKSILKAVGIAVLIPTLYVLSSGPALYLDDHDWLPARDAASTFYTPPRWAAGRSKSTNRLLLKWAQFWESLPP